jgi:transcriptional regulator GlxA family with amidase domain
MNIDIILFDGHDELDVLGPFEVFKMAEAAGAEVHVRRVTRTSQPTVTASHGTRYEPDATYQPGADVLLVPGGGWIDRDGGVWQETQEGRWAPLLQEAAREGAVMASVCTGALLLAHAGIIGTRRATTHHLAWDDLAATGAGVVKSRVVDDGDLVTSGGVTCGIDMALWLVERQFGGRLADGIAEGIEYHRFRPEGNAAQPVTTSSTDFTRPASRATSTSLYD